MQNCENCANHCKEGSRRRFRLERNGYCPQWMYGGSNEDAESPTAFFGGSYNARHVYGEKDGMKAEWGSINRCAEYFCVSPRMIRNYVKSGTVVRGWRLSFESD